MLISFKFIKIFLVIEVETKRFAATWRDIFQNFIKDFIKNDILEVFVALIIHITSNIVEIQYYN